MRRDSRFGLGARGFWGCTVAASLLGACDPNIVLGTRLLDGKSGEAGSANLAGGGGALGGGGLGAPGGAGAGGAAGSFGGATIEGPVNVIWSTSAESGDLSDWDQGGETQGGIYLENELNNDVSTERAHSGKYGMKMVIDAEPGRTHLIRYHRTASNEGRYYSAWFYFDALHVPNDWWAFFVYRGQHEPDNFNTNVNLWDVNLRVTRGRLYVYLYDHLTDKVHNPIIEKSMPIGQWVHFEAFLERIGQETKFKLWQDDELVLDVPRLGRTSVPHLFWAIGNGSNGLEPPLSTLFVDDAVIADGRVGTNGPDL